MEDGILTMGDITSVKELSRYHDYAPCSKCRHYSTKQTILFTILKKENGRSLYIYTFGVKCPREHGAELEMKGNCFAYEIKNMGKDT